MDAWYNGYSAGSVLPLDTPNYAKTVSEYYSAGGSTTTGPFPTSHTYKGHYVDLSSSTTASFVSSTIYNTDIILTEVCNIINSLGLNDLGGNNGPWYFPVYIDQLRPASGLNSQFCAWHTAGYCSLIGNPGVYQVFQFAFFYRLDTDLGSIDTGCSIPCQGCTYIDPINSLASISGHEMSEMRSDPAFIVGNNPSNWYFGGWYDSAGNEIGDKCAWSFPTALETFPAVTGPTTYPPSSTSSAWPITKWKMQGEWSNNAYQCSTSGCPTGVTPNPTTYANNAGQVGCIGTGPYKPSSPIVDPFVPSYEPSYEPINVPTYVPSSSVPMTLPSSTLPTIVPTRKPTIIPTRNPSRKPTTRRPTIAPHLHATKFN